MKQFDAVLLLAHGTPARVEEVPQYLERVTGGRPLPREVVEEVAHRFTAVGGSPLTRITSEQGRLLSDLIAAPVYVGMRNWHPLIAEAMEQIIVDGRRKLLVICMAPQNSRTSVGLYRRAVEQAAGERLSLSFVESWHDHPLLVRAFAEALRSARLKEPCPVLFTAHSVPCRTMQSAEGCSGDAYGSQAKQTAAAVATLAGASQWYFAFQSQGMSGGPWIGPTVEATLAALHAEGVREIIVQPIGFLCDHVEVLYDIDVQFRQQARELGMALRRTASLNTSPTLIAALADLVANADAAA